MATTTRPETEISQALTVSDAPGLPASRGPGAVAARPTAPSMTDLLYTAVERGTPVAELKELVALHAQMEQRQAQKNFAAAMALFQTECPSIKKSSTAKFATRGGGEMSYTFAALDEIANTVNPILAKHGLSYTWDSVVAANTITCTCTVRHEDGFSTTSSITLPTESASAMSSQQKVGSALTFARRLSLTSALGLTTTDDDIDGRDESGGRITDDQADTLSALLEDVGADAAKFLQFLGVKTLSELPANRYSDAVAALERKRARS